MKRAALLAVAAALAALAVGLGQAAGRTASVVVPKCPSHAPQFTAVIGGTSRFVRPNAQSIRLCRYYGLSWADSHGLWRQRLIDGKATINGLTKAFNALQEPPRGIFCVKDDETEILLAFAYAGAKPERVVVRLSGCRFASNGQAVRSTTAQLHAKGYISAALEISTAELTSA